MTETTKSHRFGLFAPIVLFILVIALFKVFGPLLTDTPGATVYLEGCDNDDCAMTGHLTQQVFTGHYVLTKEDESQAIFSPDAVAMMSWPAPPLE